MKNRRHNPIFLNQFGKALAINREFIDIYIGKYMEQYSLLSSGKESVFSLGHSESRKSSLINKLSKYVGVLKIDSSITKEDGISHYGTDTWISEIMKAESEGVKLLVLDIDSGGGNALASELMHEAIKGTSMQTVAIVSQALSGAYMIACACDYIYTKSKSSRTGSIGAYYTLNKESRKLINKHLDFAYSKKSKDKNKAHREYIKTGKLDLYVEEATEWDNNFMELVVNSRGLNRDNEALTGDIYFSDKAEELGLIDGVVNEVEFFNKIKKTKLDMSFDIRNFINNLATKLGVSTDSEGVERPNEIVALEIESKVNDLSEVDTKLELITEELNSLKSSNSREDSEITTGVNQAIADVNNLNAKVEDATSKLSALNEQIEALKTENLQSKDKIKELEAKLVDANSGSTNGSNTVFHNSKYEEETGRFVV